MHESIVRKEWLNLVINADDFGISSEVNCEIVRGIEAGVITSATILANAPATSEAIRYARSNPHISFGIHLNLTQFEPLTTRILDSDLCIDRVFREGRAWRAALWPTTLAAIRAEWSAQITLLRDSGINISHIDGHQHIHTRPGLFPILLETAHRHAILRVRPTRNVFACTPRASRLLMKKSYNSCLRFFGLRIVDFFGSLQDVLVANIPHIRRHGFVEAMVHPGHSAYHQENQLLGLAPRFYEVSGFRLTTYHLL